MLKIKKYLTIAGFLVLLSGLFSVWCAVAEYNDANPNKLFFISYVVEIIISIITSTIFFVFASKSQEQIIKNRRTFFILAIVNIFNNGIAWAVCFWIEIVIGKLVRNKMVDNIYNFNNQENNDYDDNTINLNKDDYSIKKSVQSLSERLQELKEAYDNNLITEEEYNKLRQEAIDSMMK